MRAAPGPGLFARLQDAAFYHGFHVAAAELMGPGHGRTWLDVGTGPGILARLAADHGYRAKGIDRDALMIRTAERFATGRRSHARFAVSDIEAELSKGHRYDVVSASSLVVVTPDPIKTVSQLQALTAPGGRLLIIEASSQMKRWRAIELLVSGKLGTRGYMLIPWAMARSGRTLDETLIETITPSVTRHQLAHGLVDVWVVEAMP